MSQCCNNCDCDRHRKTVTGVLEQPRYSPGLILEDSDLTAAVDYTRELSRTLFRSLFGCGVICGLDVSVDDRCDLKVTVAPGLALDGCGDPVQVPSAVTITLTDRDDVIPKEAGEAPKRKDFWVVLCGKQKFCAPRPVLCDADETDGAAQPTRVRSLAEISIDFKRPHCLCECNPLKEELSEQELDALANAMLPPVRDGQAGEPDLPDCHKAHAEELDCRCDCGECVLLAWIHWFPGEGWAVLHRGVRRFIRPVLIAPDPIRDRRGAAADARLEAASVAHKPSALRRGARSQ